MKPAVIIAAVVATILFSGCADMKRSTVSFEAGKGGALSIWEPDMSAAVLYPSGQMCMQRALAIVTHDTAVTASVSEAVLQLSRAAAKASDQNRNDDLAKIAATIKQTASLLTTTTERTAFLDFGLFYICQMSANGSLTDSQTAQLVKAVTLAAASLDLPANSESFSAIQNLQLDSGENTATPATPVAPQPGTGAPAVQTPKEQEQVQPAPGTSNKLPSASGK